MGSTVVVVMVVYIGLWAIIVKVEKIYIELLRSIFVQMDHNWLL